MSGLRNFLISLAIGLAIFGLLAWILLNVFFPKDSSSKINKDIQTSLSESLEKLQSHSNLNEEDISSDDPVEDKYNGESFTIAFGVANSVNSKLLNVVVLKTDEENEKIIYMPFPTSVSMKYSVTGNDGEKYEVSTTLGDLFGSYGEEYIHKKLSNLMGINIDYFMFLGADGIKSIVDSVDGVSFTVPSDVLETKVNDLGEEEIVTLLKSGTRVFNGKEAAIALCDEEYVGDEESFMKMHVDFLSSIMEKILTEYGLQKAEDLVSKAIRSARTNYTAADFENNSELVVSSCNFEKKVCYFPKNIIEISGETAYSMLLDNYKEFR